MTIWFQYAEKKFGLKKAWKCGKKIQIKLPSSSINDDN